MTGMRRCLGDKEELVNTSSPPQEFVITNLPSPKPIRFHSALGLTEHRCTV